VVEFSRKNNFTNQISIVDGQPGCGKTLFSNIIQSFQRAEIFNYVFELEFIIKLHKFEKISNDAIDSLIKMLVDHKIYQNMMSRDVNFRYNDQELPYYAFGCEEEYFAASEIDKAVIIMKNLTKKNNLKRIELKKKENFLTVPFEQFVISPNAFLSKICNILKTSYGSKTIRILKKNKVPRIKVEDGIDLPIYRIMGWQPPIKNLTIKDELAFRRNYAINNGISNRYLEELDMMSEDYIKNYSWF